MATIPVKFFHSQMVGAPTVTNNFGDLTALLDACLVTGFGLKNVTSITCTGADATVTISSGHSFAPDQVVKIDGCTQPEYNGEFRVVQANANSFTIKVAGSPATPATTAGSITAKIASLDWEKPFSSGLKAAYRSKSMQSTRNILLVDNGPKGEGYDNQTWAKWANVGIVEDMTDIDTIVGAQAPFDPASPTQNWKSVQPGQFGWYKWYYARTDYYELGGDRGAGNRNWVLVGDDQIFFLFVTNAAGFSWLGRNFYCFGDLQSFKPGDQYSTVLCADDAYWSDRQDLGAPGQRSGYGLVSSLDFSSKLMLRNHTQLGGPVRWATTSLNTNNGQQVCGRGPMPFPNGADYSLWLLPTYVRQEDGHMRGLMPGMLWMPQDRPYSDLTVVNNVVGQEGKRFLLVRTQFGGETEGAQVAFDITGPWR